MFEDADDFDELDGPLAVAISLAALGLAAAVAVGLLGGQVLLAAGVGGLLGAAGAGHFGWRKLLGAAVVALIVGAIFGLIAWGLWAWWQWDVTTGRLSAAIAGAWLGFCGGLMRESPVSECDRTYRDGLPSALILSSVAATILGLVAYGILYGCGWLDSPATPYVLGGTLLVGVALGAVGGWNVAMEDSRDSSFDWGDLFGDGSGWEGFWSLSDKQCGRCGRSVSLSASAGDSCPHCGARWSYEKTIYKGGGDFD